MHAAHHACVEYRTTELQGVSSVFGRRYVRLLTSLFSASILERTVVPRAPRVQLLPAVAFPGPPVPS